MDGSSEDDRADDDDQGERERIGCGSGGERKRGLSEKHRRLHVITKDNSEEDDEGKYAARHVGHAFPWRSGILSAFFLSSFLPSSFFYLWFAATDFSVDRVVEMHTIEPPEMSPNLQLSYKVARAAREEYSAVAREGGNGLDLDIDDVGAADADADADVVIVEEESTMDEAAAELASALAQRLEVVAAERRRAAEDRSKIK